MPSFLTAEWRHLILANYQVNPEILKPYVPRGVELDSHEGIYYVSLVGFMFLKTRIMGIPVPFHINFEEINLRFYVRRGSGQDSKRGVVFIKEIVPLPTLAWVARVFYNENYVAMPTDHFFKRKEDQLELGYSWKDKGNISRLSAIVNGKPVIPDRGSLGEFIIEHYWGYVTQKNGSCLEYQVKHEPWSLWIPERFEVECDGESLYGKPFGSILSDRPSSVIVADGSLVSVEKGICFPES